MGKTKKAQQKETINITHILLGVGLLALTIYTGWIIIQAPDSTGYDTIAAYSADLQKKMGFLGGLIYLLMHGLMGKGIVLFPFSALFKRIKFALWKTAKSNADDRGRYGRVDCINCAAYEYYICGYQR